MNLGYSFFIGGCCATCAAWKFLSQADSFQPKGLSPWDRGNLPGKIPSHGPATQASRNRENPGGWQERWGGTALTNNIGSGAFERGVNEHMFVRCCETLGWQWCWQECAAQRGLWSQPASQPLGPLFEPWLAHFSVEEVFEHVGDVQFAASCDCFERCQPHCGNHSMLYRRKASVVDSIVWICHIFDHLVSVAVDARVFHEADLCFSGQVVHCPTWSISKREGYFGLGQLSLEFSILDHFLVPTLLYTALVHICDLPAKWSDVNMFGEVGKPKFRAWPHGLFNLMFLRQSKQQRRLPLTSKMIRRNGYNWCLLHCLCRSFCKQPWHTPWHGATRSWSSWYGTCSATWRPSSSWALSCYQSSQC